MIISELRFPRTCLKKRNQKENGSDSRDTVTDRDKVLAHPQQASIVARRPLRQCQNNSHSQPKHTRYERRRTFKFTQIVSFGTKSENEKNHSVKAGCAIDGSPDLAARRRVPRPLSFAEHPLECFKHSFDVRTHTKCQRTGTSWRSVTQAE